jgi:Ca-activated chloride channel family protein
LGEKRQQVLDSVSGIFEGGTTVLYDATLAAYETLQKDGDPKHIRAVVVLTDGQDTASTATMDEVLGKINATLGEGGNSIKLFTIAFGSDADKSVLQKLADPTGGKEYDSSPENIQKIYDDIATFF